ENLLATAFRRPAAKRVCAFDDAHRPRFRPRGCRGARPRAVLAARAMAVGGGEKRAVDLEPDRTAAAAAGDQPCHRASLLARRQRPLEVRDRALERTVDPAAHEDAIVEALQAPSRFVLDHEPVPKALAVGIEMALVPCVGKSVLRAVVLDQAVRLEPPERHPELDLSAEQLDDDPR